MEAITHILIGVVLQIVGFKYFIFPWNFILTIIFSFFSHFFIDALAKITYHTPEAHKEDKFWVIWHIIILIASLGAAIYFFIPYWLGAISANLVDIWDWAILRPIQNRKKKKENIENWGEKYFIHSNVIDIIREKIFFWLPNLNYKKYGIIPEIMLIILFISLIILLK
ncbi:MAG: hypothetical protein ACQERB_02195 [Promethearchaeati archaeon]